MPAKNSERPTEVWEKLLQESNLYDRLWDIYSDEFLNPFAKRFNLTPFPSELIQGVHKTARAYLDGKWLKEVNGSDWLVFSGERLVDAGEASKKLAYSISQ